MHLALHAINVVVVVAPGSGVVVVVVVVGHVPQLAASHLLPEGQQRLLLQLFDKHSPAQSQVEPVPRSKQL